VTGGARAVLCPVAIVVTSDAVALFAGIDGALDSGLDSDVEETSQPVPVWTAQLGANGTSGEDR
jgi:hypothetical protein